MQEVWFDLEDGRVVDPNECAPDEAGVLMHSSGVAVKMRAPGVPWSRGVSDADARRADASAPASDSKPKGGKGKAMKPEETVAGGYKTRESKVD